MRHETIDVRKKGVRRETIDASHVSRLASKTPLVSRLTSHVRSAPAAAWPKVKLGEVCASISDGDHLPPPKCESGVPFVTISDIKNNRFDLANTRFVPKAYFDAIDEKRRIRKGDVLYSVVGSYGIPVYADKDLDIAFQRHIAILKPGKDVDSRYLYYSLLNPAFYNAADNVAIGAAQKTITLSALRNLEIPLPPLPVQRQIADILSAYDDLIENNRRRIAILEETARLAYRKWFGGEVGRTTTLGEVCQSFGGGTPKTNVSEYWNGDVPWVVPTDVTRNSCLALLDTERKITALGLEKSSAKMLPANAILMTSRASVGYFAIADFPVCTNQGFISIVPNDAAWRWYLLFNLMSRVEEIRGNAKGSTFPEISRARFRSMDISVPDKESLESLNDIVTPLMQQVRILSKQSAALAAARDMLLPRLMKGDVA